MTVNLYIYLHYNNASAMQSKFSSAYTVGKCSGSQLGNRFSPWRWPYDPCRTGYHDILRRPL